MESPGLFLFISTTITFITATAITIYVRFSVKQAVSAKIQESSLKSVNRKIEERLVVARQMATIGALAGGMSFHLDSTFRGLQELTKLLRSSASHDSSIANLSKLISNQLADAIAVSSRVCQATYPERQHFSPISASKIVADVFDRIHQPDNVVVKTRLKCEDEIIFANEELVRLVLENVLNNAFEATDKKGRILVSFSNPDTISNDSDTHNAAQSAPCMEIIITDNGVGMSPESLDEVFLPQFGSKTKSGSGSGLGLSISYAIMQMLQGNIAISSKEGVGTTVSLKIPLALDRKGQNLPEPSITLLNVEELAPYLHDRIVGEA